MMFSYTLLAGFYQQADQCVFIRAYRVLTAPQSAHNTRARRNAASTIDDCMYALILTKVWVRSEGHKFFNLPRVELQMGLLNRDRNLFPSTKIFDPDLLKQQHRGVRFSSPFPRQPPSEYAQPEDFSPKSSLLFGGTEDPISPLSVSEDSPMVVFRRQPDLVSSMRGNIPTLIKQLSDAARSISRSNSMISLSSDGGGENEQPPFTPRRYSKYAVELEESINTFAFRLNEILTGGSIVPMTLHSSLIDLDQWIQSLGSFNSYSNDDGSHDKTTDAIQRMHRLLNNQQLAGRYIWRTKSQPLESALTRSLRTSFEAPSGSDNLNGIGKYLPPIRTNSRLNLVTDEEGEAVEGKRRVADVAVDANNPSDWRMFADETNVDDQQSEPGYYSADSGGSSTMARSQPIAIRGGMKRYRSWPRGHPRE
jgi:hypothetical protein